MEINPAGRRVTLTVGGTAAAAVGSQIWSIGIVPAAADTTLTLREDDGSGAVMRVIFVKASLSSKDLDLPKPYGRGGSNIVHATLEGAGAIAYIAYD